MRDPLMLLSDFASMYDEHMRVVYGFLAYRLDCREDAEDLTQLTFERALRARERYDPERAGFQTWLLAIARNLLIDYFRNVRGPRQRSLEDLPFGYEGALTVWDDPDVGNEPELDRALALLPERERELVALRFGSELSGREIAELTGLSLANVQQILSRALRRMRANLARTHARVETDADAAEVVVAA
jgi:RNA polymerase sigma factor (sigma-70 family)